MGKANETVLKTKLFLVMHLKTASFFIWSMGHSGSEYADHPHKLPQQTENGVVKCPNLT